MFLLDCEARRLTLGTRQIYTAKLSLFIRWCDRQDIHALHELSAHDIRRYLVHLSRRKLSAQYQHNIARAIRAFLNYCVRDELLDNLALRQGADAAAGKKVSGRTFRHRDPHHPAQL